ncbi:hypothetical protein ACWHAR_26435, partial [Bacillus sp. LR--39]
HRPKAPFLPTASVSSPFQLFVIFIIKQSISNQYQFVNFCLFAFPISKRKQKNGAASRAPFFNPSSA